VCESQLRAICPHVRGRRQQEGHRVPAEPLIAVIDDDETMRIGLVMLVRSAGYAVQGFASAEGFLGLGQDALSGFACVVTDIQMPGLSGIELKRRLSAARSPLPVIMITARNEAGLEERARAAGAICLLKKPFEAAVLIRWLESTLGA
jgi:FixJ family two-component response regulator